MPSRNNIWAVIPAAGIGSRMQSDTPKQYLKIRDKSILEYTLERFCEFNAVNGVMVVLAKEDRWWSELGVSGHEKIMQTRGGLERCHSVLNGLKALEECADADEDDWVMVHDAARPCLRKYDIEKLIQCVIASENGGLLAIPVRDTMKRGNRENIVTETVDRTGLWHALTPQMFRLAELKGAIESALQKSLMVTDEAQAMELQKINPLLVEGHPDNIKITHPRDLVLAELFLAQTGDPI